MAAYHALAEQGCNQKLEVLATQLKFGPEGTTFASLSELFSQYGLQVQCREMNTEQLVELLKNHPEMSCIAHIHQNHLVSVAQDSRGRMLCFDYPNWYIVPSELFSKTFSQRVLLISPRGNELPLLQWPGVMCLASGVLCAVFILKSKPCGRTHSM